MLLREGGVIFWVRPALIGNGKKYPNFKYTQLNYFIFCTSKN